MRLMQLCIGLAAALLAASAAAKDLSAMSGDEIRLLQQRLTDARCYAGPIDGQASAATMAAKAACPDQEPVLTIETGMHTAKASGIATDAACAVMATSSTDKTVRLWSLPDGRLKQTIRLPIGDISGGKAYAVALSPDGRLLAAGGYDAAKDAMQRHGLYLTDLASGAVRRLGAFESVVTDLAFSADGRRLAVALADTGIRILDVASGAEVMVDRFYGGDSYGLAFTADGGLVTTSRDGFIRRYGADLKLINRVKAPDGTWPEAIATDATGARLAVGYANALKISVLDADTLKSIARVVASDITAGNFASVTWSRDGRLWGGGAAQTSTAGRLARVIRPFSAGGPKVNDDKFVSDGVLSDMTPCGEGVAYAAEDPTFGVIGSDGRISAQHGPVTADMRGKLGDAFTATPDGQVVRFGLGAGGRDAVAFDVASARLDTAAQIASGLMPARTAGLKVTNWQERADPAYNGRPIKLKQNETAYSLAIRPRSDGFVLGTLWSLHAIDAGGTELWNVRIPGAARGVNLTADGSVVMAALDDGTIRWYRWADGKELLALFVYKPDKRWVAWTPTGYYMASPGGEDLIGWHMNRGWDQPPDFFPASRFREKFARPDIVQKVLQTQDEAEAIRQADALASRKPTETKPIEAQLPPVIQITSPRDGATAAGGTVTLDYTLRSPSGLPVDAIEVMIDGRPLAATRGLSRVDEAAQAACPGIVTRGLSRVAATAGEATCRITVPVPVRGGEIGLVARAGQVTSVPAIVRLAGGMGGEGARGRLIVLSIGVAHYADPALHLGLPAKDASDFAAALQGQKGNLYSDVVVRSLLDDAASRANILDGFDWLEKQKPTPEDVTVVFMAGHGTTDEKGQFWFLPADVRTDALRASAVSQDDLRRTLQALPSKVVLFLDACHSGGAAGAMAAQKRGNVDMNAIVNDFSTTDSGVVTFASSMGRELSQENPAWGNGAFTKAVLEGIRDGKADIFRKGRITVSQLNAFVADRVAELTDQQQHAVMVSPPTISDFPLAAVR